MIQHIKLPFGSNPTCPLGVDVVAGMSDEIGKVLVVKDTNGAPLFRFALAQIGPSAQSPRDYGLVLTVFAPITLNPVWPFDRAGRDAGN